MTARRGIQWQPAIETVRGSCPQARVWRRQMVLGPAAEFAVETPAEAEIDVPAGWQPGYADTSSHGRVRFVISLTSNDDERRFRLLRAFESGL